MSESEILTSDDCMHFNLFTLIIDYKRGKENKAKLMASKFKQQTLTGWRPNPNMVTTLITFVIFGVIFLSLGILLVEFSKDIKESSITYHELCANTPECKVTIEIKESMKQPIYVYYALENFYQNHRRYVKSRNNPQLKGTIKSVDDLSSGEPIVTVGDLGFNKVLNGSEIPDDYPANPGGLIAKSYFNDSYWIADPNGNNITINEKGIAWSTDSKDLFKNSADYKSVQWMDYDNEHFVVWMRVAGFPNFKKLWGKIEEDLDPGNYTLTVFNNYDVSSFDGTKAFFMSTTDSYGGKNTFLAVGYLVVGSLGVIFAIVFLVAHLRQKKRQAKTK